MYICLISFLPFHCGFDFYYFALKHFPSNSRKWVPSAGQLPFSWYSSSPSLGTPSQGSNNRWGYYCSCHPPPPVFSSSLYFVRRTAFTFAPLLWKYSSRAHYFPLKYFPVVWHIILSVIAKAKISGLGSTYFYIWHLQAPCTRFLYIFLKAFCI